MENIKIIIWDLDNTLWKGILGEEKIFPIRENIELIKRANEKGIINSICSNNDYLVAKEELIGLGIWDLFILPSISWGNKGNRIKELLYSIGLREENALFIDDDIKQLFEVKSVLQNIQVNLTKSNDLLSLYINSLPCIKDTKLELYKIKEKSINERSKFHNNLEFLRQSEIKISFNSDCENQIDRIYELISKSNQLNFTKLRPSKENLIDTLRNDTFESKYITLNDKYGNYGIIGFYTLNTNHLVHFVFSCRVLGMGIEQWVYSSLNFPFINVQKPVAIKLNSTYIPDWIHEENNTYVSDSIGVEDKYLAVYGFCPMRPIWEYLRNTIRGCTFFEIDPTPSICNLAVALRESKSSIEKILKNVSMFDSDITFNKDILLGDYKYLLVSAMNEDEIWVNTYENIKFYTSSQLSIENATIEFLEKVESRPICTTDIYNEIEFLCKNISKKMKIIFLNNSEVEFATKGKDLNYNFRLKTNEILEELSSIHKNLILIDFNKFAANEFDFFDEKINHYNREIGYKIAQEIAKIIGMNESKKISENKSVINKKICFNNESEILFKSILENGNLQININLSNFTKNRLALVVLRNRNIYWESDILEKIDKNLAISTIGIYDFVVKIFDLAKKEIFSIKIDGYPFTQYNYIDFINPNKQNYNEYRILLESFIKRNLKDYLNLNSFSLILNNLHSVGINLADFFLFKSISNIDLVITHKEYLFQILPLLHNSKIVINNIYTTEEISKINVYDIKQKRFIIYKIKPLKDGIVKSFSKVILFDNKPIHHAYNILIKGGSQIYFLSSVLSYLTTKKIFLDDIIANMYTHGIKTYAIRLPRPERRSFDMTSIKNEERAIVRLLKNKDFTKEIYEKFPPSYRNKVFTELKTEIDSIRYSKIEGNHYVLCDVSNEYVNIKNGFRNVKYSQKDCKNNLFLIGGKNSIGYGVSDSETIGSYLQKFIGNKYCVKSYSNFEGNKQKDYENIFYAFQEKKIILNKGDIVVFILDNSINEGFRKIYENSIDWNAIIDNPHIKTIDGYSLFLNGNRQNYFFSNFGYTKECNYDIAKLIKNNL